MLDAMDRKTISMARLAKDPETIARDIETSGAIYCIKRRGRPPMLLMNEEYFEGWRVVIELMQQPGWREELEQSRRDFAEGRFRSLDEIEKEFGLDRPTPTRRRGTAARSTRTSRAKGPQRTARARSRSA
jgi:antitoxin YefM